MERILTLRSKVVKKIRMLSSSLCYYDHPHQLKFILFQSFVKSIYHDCLCQALPLSKYQKLDKF